MRAWIVGTGTRKARAISSLVRPPTARSVRATRASGGSTGWQATNISARMSSSTRSGSHGRSSDRSGGATAPELGQDVAVQYVRVALTSRQLDTVVRVPLGAHVDRKGLTT